MRKDKITKVISIIAIISSLITLLSIAYDFLLPIYILNKYIPGNKGTASIGIIGGADGPTSIFVSSSASIPLVTIIFAAISAAGFGVVLLRKRRG